VRSRQQLADCLRPLRRLAFAAPNWRRPMRQTQRQILTFMDLAEFDFRQVALLHQAQRVTEIVYIGEGGCPEEPVEEIPKQGHGSFRQRGDNTIVYAETVPAIVTYCYILYLSEMAAISELPCVAFGNMSDTQHCLNLPIAFCFITTIANMLNIVKSLLHNATYEKAH
jgi:hypothetical protein